MNITWAPFAEPDAYGLRGTAGPYCTEIHEVHKGGVAYLAMAVLPGQWLKSRPCDTLDEAKAWCAATIQGDKCCLARFGKAAQKLQDYNDQGDK